MESSSSSPEAYRRRRYGLQFPSGSLQTPVSAFLELLGVFRGAIHQSDHEAPTTSASVGLNRNRDPPSGSAASDAEVSIRIIASGEMEQIRAARTAGDDATSSSAVALSLTAPIESASNSPPSAGPLTGVEGTDSSETATVTNERDTGPQRYDFQQLARWIEQVLPFSMLLLMVFIRQHLQGFLVTLWISVVMIKSNDLLRKQTALKGERKNLILCIIGLGLSVQVVAIYWRYSKENLLRQLLMLPPKEIPKFWHAVFIIVVNDTMVRQGAMVVKCGLLIYYKNTRGRNYRRQGQLLTFIEYVLLLYRALLPTPVWYRFFLNKDYGSLFSSLTTGLYLTFKLTSVLEKVQTFIAALKALSRREVQYGSYATTEEVVAAGDLCAICQEKMHAPISLSCKHIFCEDCVSEWFERERTCPLCRAVVKPAELRSFGDGSTSLFYQIF